MSDADWQRTADELEIRNLLNSVANLADGDDLDAYLACYTDDAVWSLPTGGELCGLDNIRAGSLERRAAGMQGPGTNSLHYVTNQVVHVDGSDTATSESRMMMIRNTTTSPVVASVMCYEDTLRRTADGWKLARRRLVPG